MPQTPPSIKPNYLSEECYVKDYMTWWFLIPAELSAAWVLYAYKACEEYQTTTGRWRPVTELDAIAFCREHYIKFEPYQKPHHR